MLKRLDHVLDHLTMYRLVLYYLVALVAAAFVLGFFGIVPRDPTAIAFSTVVIVAVTWVTNRLFALVFDVPANRESTLITALILVLILEPVTAADPRGVGLLVFASVWATASKFIVAIGRKHLFNPAALGVALPALLLGEPATWWVGGIPALMPIVLVGGLLLLRKLQRFDLVATFALVTIGALLATTPPAQYGGAQKEMLLSSPLFFFAFVMLTEPLTAPTARWPRLSFAALVGLLFSPNVHFGSYYLTPELALLAGNLFAYLAGPRSRFVLVLERIEQAAADTYDFVFRPHPKLAFQAGQYLEWTLATPHADTRGNRRYFTIASAPGEKAIRLGVKFNAAPSAFKHALGAMAPGDVIHAAALAGSFTLPRDPKRKLAFLAGGIGITPFRSMLQHLIDAEEARPIVVLYGTATQEDIAYRDVLDAAERKLGIRTIHAVAEGAAPGEYPGFIDERLLRAAVPDFAERTFYISGPQAMVTTLRATLVRMGVSRFRIRTDFFPGLA